MSQSRGSGPISGEIRAFNLYPGTSCMSFVCVLFCIVSDRGPDILLTKDSGPKSASHYRRMVHGHLNCKFLLNSVQLNSMLLA